MYSIGSIARSRPLRSEYMQSDFRSSFAFPRRSVVTRLLLLLLPLFLASCDTQHSGYTSSEFSGDYRVYAEIAEFFDCDEQVKYFVAKSGVHSELAEKYAALGVPEKEDVYIKVEGYLKKEAQMEGIDPITVFVPTKFISFDQTRGCEMGRQQGH